MTLGKFIECSLAFTILCFRNLLQSILFTMFKKYIYTPKTKKGHRENFFNMTLWSNLIFNTRVELPYTYQLLNIILCQIQPQCRVQQVKYLVLMHRKPKFWADQYKCHRKNLSVLFAKIKFSLTKIFAYVSKKWKVLQRIWQVDPSFQGILMFLFV